MLSIQKKYKGLKPGLYTFVNPFSYVVLCEKMSKNELSEFEIYADGVFIVWIERIFRNNKINRISFDFTSIADSVFESASNAGLVISFIGATERDMKRFMKIIQSSYPKLKLGKCSPGYFHTNIERDEMLNSLSNSDVIVVGMGAFLQEMFLLDLKKKGWAGVGFTCGGFIEQTSKSNGAYYPCLVDRFNIRWLYRLLKEPKKLWYRYLVQYPYFVFFYIKNLFV